jgi:DNA-binding transcriptional ArsR family regulator
MTRNIDISGRMTETQDIARALAALGHETRLAIYRLLVKAGDAGLNVGEIGRHLGAPPSTLAHHLGALVDAGLVIQERHGREVINRADYEAMRRTVGFLTAECCTGVRLSEDDAA